MGDFIRVRPQIVPENFERTIRHKAMLSVVSMCDDDAERLEFLQMLGLVDELGNIIESESATGHLGLAPAPNKDVVRK